MKFHNNIAVAIVFSGGIGTILAEIFLRPPIYHHLINRSIMLALAICMGLLGGSRLE